MIDVYTANTQNGVKIPIALEELSVPYKIINVNLSANEQKKHEFLSLNPNGKIPVIVDHDASDGKSLTVFESGAILVYLAEKYDALLPSDARGRTAALGWLFFQVGGVGPMFGQYGWFNRAAPQKISVALERYRSEANRLTQVLESRLQQAPWLAGSDYSIADIANFSWLRNAGYGDVDITQFPAVNAWVDTINARPAVQRGLVVMKNV